MTKSDLMADLEYASKLAKDGAATPLLGSPIGLMWGILLTLIMGYQYAILSGKLGLPEETLALAWIAYGVTGGFGSWYLGKKIDNMPGAQFVNNRLEGYVWAMFVGALATIVIGSIINMLWGRGDQTVWNTVVVFAFAAQGMAYGIIAKMTKLRILHIASLGSFILSAISFLVIHDPVIYLIASIGAVVTIIMPNLVLRSQAKSGYTAP